ncbi:MAG: TRAP transporter small permease subunit [Rhodobacterales bacterium]
MKDTDMRAFRAIEIFNRNLGVLSGFATLIVTLLIVTDITLRGIFNAPLRGATELSTLLLIALVYLGLASVQAGKHNYQVEILTVALPRVFRWRLEIFTTLLSAVAIGILAYHTSLEAIHSTTRRESSFGAIIFPIWPARLVIAVGFILLYLQLMIDALQLYLGGPPPPMAKKLVKSERNVV